MTEPVEVAIPEALYAWLKTPSLGAPIATPFVSYTPTTNVAYLDVRPLLRAEPTHFGISTANSDILRGIFQIDAVMPDSVVGQNPGIRLASLIAARFPLNLTLSVISLLGTRTLRVRLPPTIAAAVKDAPWIRFPVSIPYELIT